MTARKRVQAWALLNEVGDLLSLHTERGTHDWKSRYLMKDFRVVRLVEHDPRADKVLRAVEKMAREWRTQNCVSRLTMASLVELVEAWRKGRKP